MLEAVREHLGDHVERLDHVALAVRDPASASRLMAVLGATFLDGGDETEKMFRWLQFVLPGGGKIELITPIPGAHDDHFLVRFFASRGEGLHHITLKVRDLDMAIATMEGAGYRIADIDRSNPAWREAFVHPSSAHGVLIQLAEWDDDAPGEPTTLEDVLAGVKSAEPL